MLDSAIQHPLVRTVLAVQKRYKRDAADQLAAAIGFFGFLSLVPLLLLAVAAAGFVYADPADQAEVALRLTEALPGFEETLGGGDSEVASLIDTVVRNRGTVTLVGLVTLLLTGLRLVAAAMAATRVVFRGAVVSGLLGWLKKLASMVVLGIAALLAVAGSSLAAVESALLPRPLAFVLGLLVAFLFDLVLFLTAYRMLSTTTSMRARQLLPGAILAAVGWSLLKTAGATYVGGQMDSASALYGALGGVIALLLLLYLAGRLYLYGAELSAVLVEARQGPLREPVDTSHEAGEAHEADEADEAERLNGRDGAEVAGHDGAVPRRAVSRSRSGSTSHPRSPSRATGSGTARGSRSPERHDDADDGTTQLRRAIGFGLAVAAMAVGWRFLGPASPEDELTG